MKRQIFWLRNPFQAKIVLPSLDIIDVIGYNYYPDLHKAMLNGREAHMDLKKSSYSMLTKRLYIETAKFIKLPILSKVILTWPHSEVPSRRDELKWNSEWSMQTEMCLYFVCTTCIQYDLKIQWMPIISANYYNRQWVLDCFLTLNRHSRPL